MAVVLDVRVAADGVRLVEGGPGRYTRDPRRSVLHRLAAAGSASPMLAALVAAAAVVVAVALVAAALSDSVMRSTGRPVAASTGAPARVLSAEPASTSLRSGPAPSALASPDTRATADDGIREGTVGASATTSGLSPLPAVGGPAEEARATGAAGTRLADPAGDQAAGRLVDVGTTEAQPGVPDPATTPAWGSPDGTTRSGTGAEPSPCTVTATSGDQGFDSFYGQVCWILGIPVVASSAVDPGALQAAARTIAAVLTPRPDVTARLVDQRMKVAVLGVHERAVDLPEYRDLPTRYPATDWDAARAYSATPTRPLLSAPEENLVCSSADTYPGQQVLVHELGHSVMDLAVRTSDPTTWQQVQQAYAAATGAGSWVGYYGGTSATEYWAEGVQAYFDASHRTPGTDPLGSPVASREELAAYDPALYSLVRATFGDNPWRATCP